MTIAKINIIPHDVLVNIAEYLNDQEKRILAKTCKIFREARVSYLFDRIIPGDPEKGEPLPISRLIPAHRQFASTMCAMRAKNVSRFQQPICTKTIQLDIRGTYSLFFSDGKTMITTSNRHTIEIYDTETGACTRTLFGHTDHIHNLVLSPDEKVLISGSEKGTIKIWDIKTGTCTRSEETNPDHQRKKPRRHSPYFIRSLSITPDGENFILTPCSGFIQIKNIETGECIKTVEIMQHYNRYLPEQFQTLITPNGKYFILEQKTLKYDSSIEIKDSTAIIYDLENSKIKDILHDVATKRFIVTPDGEKIIASFLDDTIKIYDIETTKYKIIPIKEPSDIRDLVAITPDGTSLIVQFQKGTIGIYDIESGACLRTMTLGRYNPRITSSASDGRTFVLELDLLIEIWKLCPLLEEVMASSGKASPEEIARYALLDTSQYLKMIADRKNRPSSNLCSSAVQFAINRIWSLPPEIQQELYREYRTPTLTEGPTIASFLQRINELPEEMQELFSAKLEEAASQELRTPLSLPPELA